MTALNAEIIMLIGGVCAFSASIFLARTRLLREKYALGWILVGSFLLLLGLFPRFLIELAHAFKLGYATLALLVFAMIAGLFALIVSISLSRLYRRNIRLTQEIALQEVRIETLEKINAMRDIEKKGIK